MPWPDSGSLVKARSGLRRATPLKQQQPIQVERLAVPWLCRQHGAIPGFRIGATAAALQFDRRQQRLSGQCEPTSRRMLRIVSQCQSIIRPVVGGFMTSLTGCGTEVLQHIDPHRAGAAAAVAQ